MNNGSSMEGRWRKYQIAPLNTISDRQRGPCRMPRMHHWNHSPASIQSDALEHEMANWHHGSGPGPVPKQMPRTLFGAFPITTIAHDTFRQT